MKCYIEKDVENRVITKGITVDEAILNENQIEVTEVEFNQIEQYTPPIGEIVIIPSFEDRLIAIEDTINFILGL